MSKNNHSTLVDTSTIKEIMKSRKDITILFSDIEGSTNFWDTRGDMSGRLMVHCHNKLLFPAIEKFGGTIIKTIGDSIMARFNSPQQALYASIAMQQMLKKYSKEKEDFDIKIRIGLHSGKAFVETDDVYGDVVNMAARLEGKAKAKQILLSRETVRELKKKEFKFSYIGKFIPKGKSKALHCYQYDWLSHEDLSSSIKTDSNRFFIRKHRVQIMTQFLVSLVALFYIYVQFIRFVLVDNESIAISMLNPGQFPSQQPIISSIILLFIIGIFFTLFRVKNYSSVFLRILNGGFLFATFLLVMQSITYLSGDLLPETLNQPVYQSKHLFVEVKVDNAQLREGPSLNSKRKMTLQQGTLLLLNRVVKNEGLIWNRVMLEKGNFAWIVRSIPATIGVPEKRISLTNKFYISKIDSYIFAAAILALIFGIFRFGIRPS